MMLGNINVEKDASRLNKHLDIVITLVYGANDTHTHITIQMEMFSKVQI